MITESNPTGMLGLAFVEWSAADPTDLDRLFRDFGFSRTRRHRSAAVDYYGQNAIHFFLNTTPDSFASRFAAAHGPSICGLGIAVEDAAAAYEAAVARGARPVEPGAGGLPFDLRAVYGIGDAVMYFVDGWGAEGDLLDREFVVHPDPLEVPDRGFLTVDHLTNNVYKGTLNEWADFYTSIFGFTEVRHFDIRGEKTGLYSFALRSPDGSFCIPINEGTETKSQIEKYLHKYNKPGVQHLAFLSNDLLASLDAMEGSNVDFLDIDDEYYAEVFDRVPNVTEDHAHIQKHQVLVDGDDEGYLLQIFTKNVVGPIFIELIQRKNHLSFGEGNFGALFRSIERDQERRGVL